MVDPGSSPLAQPEGTRQAPSRLGPYLPIGQLFALGLPLLSLSRVGLGTWHADRLARAGMDWGAFLLQGLRTDVVQVGLLAAPLLLLAPVLGHRRSWLAWKRLSRAWILFALLLLTYLEAATPGFIAQYDLRPNRLFVEYLKYPREVFATLWNGHRLELLASIVGCALAVRLFAACLRRWPLGEPTWGLGRTALAFPIVAFALFAGVRSTAGHRAVNPAYFATTSDPLVNSLVINSTWSVVHAVYNLKHESKSSESYGRMEVAEMLRLTGFAPEGPEAPRALPTRHHQAPVRPREKPLNLVILLEESMGATFVESLGGVPATPQLERLKEKGWWFEQLYATGTRSVRGIEAVVSGFLPTPARSVVKLSLSQTRFFTLASLLGDAGYFTEFVYGGEAHFDNMASFFTGNGFQSIIDQRDYPNPSFVATWGVSDEDLLDRVHERCVEHHRDGETHFTLAFSSSNHSPFEYPEGRIQPINGDPATATSAVQYADHAIGRFFDQAMQSPYWEDTLFLVVADHDIRVYGADLVPIPRFHIPGLILGADLEPRVLRTVASQVDLPTTMLSLMGVECDHPMIGRDLASEEADLPGRAFMQFGDNFAYMEGQQVAFLQPRKPATFGTYDPAQKALTLRPDPDPDLARRALAHSLLPSWLYREQLYR
jgi:phosphoglycerol transferase MdoB-like AlkP superfamily enzyme